MQVGHPVQQDSAIERTNRRLFVLECANRGASLDRCIREGANRRPIPLDEEEVTAIYREHLARLKLRLAPARETFYAMQVEMAHELVFELRNGTLVRDRAGAVVMVPATETRPTYPLRQVDNRALLGALRHLADLTGTRMPALVKIDVDGDVTDALAKIVASFDPKDRERIEAEQRQLEADAEAHRHGMH